MGMSKPHPHNQTADFNYDEALAAFQAPESQVDGVAVGKVIGDNAPHEVSQQQQWRFDKEHFKLVSPLNRAKFKVLIVGTGLAGGAAAAALGELGYNVKVFTYHDSPRRAHSIAAQGGVNSSRAKRLDNDSTYNHTKDTVKGGDYRCRENDCWRLAMESGRVIDHMNAIGAPFSREYGGTLANRSFGGVQVSRTFYTRGQTGQQLQLATTSALYRQIGAGNVEIFTHSDVQDVIVEDGVCKGIVTRNIITGELSIHTGHVTVFATGGYGNVYHMSTLAKNSNASAIMRAYEQGAYMASPSFVQFHPTGLPVNSDWQSKTILMSESLRNDGRIWTPKKKDDQRDPMTIPEDERDYFLERRYPAFGNLVPRDIASRANAQQINAGYGVGPKKNSVYLDLTHAIKNLGEDVIRERYSNLIQMYEEAIGDDAYKTPMRIAPTCHYTMGGLWTDFHEMTSIPGLFCSGESSWMYHGANRLGANSLLSSSVEGWFTLPFTIPNYLAPLLGTDIPDEDSAAAKAALKRTEDRLNNILNIRGPNPHGAEHYHRQLGEILYRCCGVARNVKDLQEGIDEIRAVRKDFWENVFVPGGTAEMNQQLEYAIRVADYLDLGELMCVDALDRDESCGAHYREDHLDEEGEAKRDDDNWCFVSAWEPAGEEKFIRHSEPLYFDRIPLMTRNYK